MRFVECVDWSDQKFPLNGNLPLPGVELILISLLMLFPLSDNLITPSLIDAQPYRFSNSNRTILFRLTKIYRRFIDRMIEIDDKVI